MGRLFMRFVFLFLLLPGIGVSQEKVPAEKLNSLMESCRFSQAYSLAELYLSKDSTRSDLLLLKGRALAAMFRYREAVEALRQALRPDSTNLNVLNELVQVYRQSGDLSKAIATSRKISTLFPDNNYFSLQLANLYYSGEDYRLAATVLLSVYRGDSSSFFVAKQLGNCYNELKRSDSAVYFYRRALKILPFDPYVTGKLVNVYIRDDQVAMALYLTQQYLKQDSASIPILKQNGYCYYLLIDFPASARQLRECIRLGDSSKFTMKYLGLSYYKQEKYDTAVAFFRDAFRIDTTDSEVCFYYGVSAFRSKAIDTGLVYLNRTMRLMMPPAKFLSSLYLELADANTAIGEADTAIILLKKALEANPENNIFRFKIAYQYDFFLHKPYEGLPWYREFLKTAAAGNTIQFDKERQISYSDYAKNRIKEITRPGKK
jgi:tetratricopeptide (TPR) repeat protein